MDNLKFLEEISHEKKYFKGRVEKLESMKMFTEIRELQIEDDEEWEEKGSLNLLIQEKKRHIKGLISNFIGKQENSWEF